MRRSENLPQLDRETFQAQQLISEIEADGKYIREAEDGLTYIAQVGAHGQPSFHVGQGESYSRPEAIRLANENHDELLGLMDNGYTRYSSEPVENAWVNTYITVDPDGTTWGRAVVKRGGYGSFVIDADSGIPSGTSVDDNALEPLNEKVRRYIYSLNGY